MPDDPPVSQGGTERGDPLNVREGEVGRLNVTRMDVATGQVKDLQVDLLREIRDATKKTGEGDNTLNSHMEKMADSMKVLVQRGSAGGGEDSQAMRGFLTDITKVGQEHEALRDILASETIEFRKWGQLFTSGVRVQFKASMRELNEQVFRASQRMSDLGAGFSSLWRETKQLFEVSRTGLMDVTAVYEDLGARALKDRDSLQSTVPMIIEMAERGNFLMGALGSSAAEISAAFEANREFVEDAFGDQLIGRASFRQQNELLSDLLNLERRAGVEGTNRDILQSRDTREQLEVLAQIAFSTGKTVAEVMKLHEQEAKTLGQLEVANVISIEERQSLRDVFRQLETQGMGEIRDELMRVLQEGGVEQGLIQAMADPAFARLMAQGQNQALWQEAMRAAASGGDPAAMADTIGKLFSRMVGFDASSSVASAKFYKGVEGAFGAIGAGKARVGAREGAAEARRRGEVGAPGGPLGALGVKEALIESQQTVGAEVTKAVNSIEEWLDNNIGTAFMGLSGAIATNIVGAIGTFLGIGAGTVVGAKLAAKGLTSTLGVQGGNVATKSTREAAERAARKEAAEQAGKKAGAKGLGKLAGKKLPFGIGLVIAAGFALDRILSEGDFAGAGLDIAEGAAAIVPGVGTAASLAIGGASVARDVSRAREAAAGPTAAGAPTAPTSGNPFYAQLVEQTTHLTSIVTLLTTANEINTVLSDNIGGFIGAGAAPTPGGPTRRRNEEAAAFSDFQSSGALS